MDKEINKNGYDYVDLGLPSGTLWATCNVGASKPSDYGFYFQWGDTKGYSPDQIRSGKGKKAFNWNDYKFNPSGYGDTFTKYTTMEAKLELEDDVAHVNMGGDWHIPSPDQIMELLNNTTTEWKTLNGVSGMAFTSKKDSSKSIFIPAAGGASNGLVGGSGNGGVIWSSVLTIYDVSCGRGLGFGSDFHSLYDDKRSYGFSVRGVIG